MSKTPDAISKKRQELGHQLRVMELKIKDLQESMSLTPEEKARKASQIEFATNQYWELKKSLRAIRNRGAISFGRAERLQPGVM